MVKLSKVSKLDNIKSWSLQARETCPGAKDKAGELVPACQGCYAVGGNYRFPNVKAPREFNRKDWKRDGWVNDMVTALDNDRYFRWFDSGDVYCLGLAEKIKEVIELTPWVKHWLPTRSYKFSKLRAVLDQINALPNAVVRFSADAIDGSYTKGLHGSTILPVGSQSEGVTACTAPKTDGKCKKCRLCWNKDIPVIGYQAHGRSMLKLIKVAVG